MNLGHDDDTGQVQQGCYQVSREGKWFGPVSEDEVLSMLDSGDIQPTDEVKDEHGGRPITAGRVREALRPSGRARHVHASRRRKQQDSERFDFFMDMGLAVFAIVLFTLIVALDDIHPRSTHPRWTGANVSPGFNTNPKSFLAGIAGPVYVSYYGLGRIFRHDERLLEYALDHTWKMGTTGYRMGFIVGALLLIISTKPVLRLVEVGNTFYQDIQQRL